MLEKQIAELLKQIADGAKAVKPEVLKAVHDGIYYQCLVPLVASAAVLVVALVAFVWCYKVEARKRGKGKAADEYYNGEQPDYFLRTLISGVLALIALGVFTDMWCDPMHWMGLFNQNAWLAAKLLNR